MNIWPSVDTLAQAKQWNYQDLTIWFSELSHNTQLQPLWLEECWSLTDCRGCSKLIRDTEGKVQTVFQYGSSMAASCWVEEQPLVYMKFTSIQH